MSEINHRWLKDNDGDRFFPVTHLDAVQGLENLVETTGWVSAKKLNNAKTKDGYSEPFYKYDDILGVKLVSLKFFLENIDDGQEILEIPAGYVGNYPHVFNVISTASQLPNKVEIKTDGKIKFILHDGNTWNKNLYAYLEVTWHL